MIGAIILLILNVIGYIFVCLFPFIVLKISDNSKRNLLIILMLIDLLLFILINNLVN